MALEQIFSLDGKVAVVTGAASGLGVAFCEAMAEAGADVVCADVNVEGMESTAESVRGLGKRALVVRCDVTKEEEVAAMVAETVETFGRLDILFNNAGIADREPKLLHKFETQEWHRVLDVDLHGVFHCAREALKVMVNQKSGKIINIASICGLVGSSSFMPIPAYTAAKGAVVNLTRELGLEYAPLGINVNAICPGFYVTRLADGAYDDPGFVDMVTALTPMGRLAQPAELKGAAIFLASAASDFVCGHMLVTDGGAVAQ